MKDIWDSKQYLQFTNERLRPATDLIAQIHLDNPGVIYDLGCGAGNVTNLLKQRWPNAEIIGIDSSADMLAKAATETTEITWINADINQWNAEKPANLIFTNATLQWLDEHETLMPRLGKMLAPNGILAIQMPRNHQSPAHIGIIEAVEAGPWRERLQPLLRFGKGNADPVAAPDVYYHLFEAYAKKINIWETNYLYVLEGENPVVEWLMGTGLRPIISALHEAEKKEFLQVFSEIIKKKYPKTAMGKTLLTYKRIFIVISV